jgi:hypothetical protein
MHTTKKKIKKLKRRDFDLFLLAAVQKPPRSYVFTAEKVHALKIMPSIKLL